MKPTKNNIAVGLFLTFSLRGFTHFLTNHFKSMNNIKPYFANSITQVFALCLFGVVMLSACTKDIDVLPSAKTTTTDTINDNTLKAGILTYYVATNGSDAAAGDVGHPWKTLSYACTRVKTPGSIIHIKTGVYLEKKECILAAGVSVEGEGATNTIIKSDFVYSSSPTSFSHALLILKSTTVNTNGNQHISGIGFDGTHTCYRAITAYYRGNVTVKDCAFKDFRASAVLFFNAHYTNITEPSTYVSGNSFYNNTVTNCATYGMDGTGGLVILGQENMSVYKNVMTDVRRSDIGYTLISGLSNRKLKIYENTFKKGTLYSTYWAFAIEIRFNHGEIEFYKNKCEGIADITYNLKRNTAYGLWIHDNTFGSDDGIIHQYGVTLEADNIGVRIERNLFKNTEYGLSITTNVKTSSVVDGIAITSNVFQNIGYPSAKYRGAAIRFSGSTTYAAIPYYRNIVIYNNTIKGNGYAITGLWLKTKGNYENIKIKNNIITGFDSYFGPIYIEKDVAQTMVVKSLVVDKNIFYATGNSNSPKYKNITPTNTFVTNTFKVDPQLVSSTNYALRSSSPAINKGVNVGLSFIGSAPDLGAFEY